MSLRDEAVEREEFRTEAAAEQDARWYERTCEVDRTLTPRESADVEAAVAQGRDRHEVLRAVWMEREDRGRHRAELKERDAAETPEAEGRRWANVTPSPRVHYPREVGGRGRRIIAPGGTNV